MEIKWLVLEGCGFYVTAPDNKFKALAEVWSVVEIIRVSTSSVTGVHTIQIDNDVITHHGFLTYSGKGHYSDTPEFSLN